jgi:hypothetical protein
MRMFHGSSSQTLALHEGLCLAGYESEAEDYTEGNGSPRAWLHAVDIDLDGLNVLELEDGYDRDGNIAPADLDPAGFPGTDVIVFADESPKGRAHITYRLLTAAALAAVTITGSSLIDY